MILGRFAEVIHARDYAPPGWNGNDCIFILQSLPPAGRACWLWDAMPRAELRAAANDAPPAVR